MIDYNKLKKANELASKMVEKKSDSINIGVEQWSDDILYTLDGSMMFGDPEEFNDIDGLIVRLKELTKPQPKYKVGDTVWHVNDEYEACSFVINRVASDETGYSYEHDCMQPEWWLEEQLYPTKQALIDAQIKYWSKTSCEKSTLGILIKSLIDEIVKTDIKKMAECEHEWIGNEKQITHCKKCGVDYPHTADKCVHEDDGNHYLTQGVLTKCKHCGEFYR